MKRLFFAFIFLNICVFSRIVAQCPSVTSENGMINGQFHPAWMDCSLPSPATFDNEHFSIDPNSPFNYDENTPYHQVSYALLKKWMGRTSCTEHNYQNWLPNPDNPTETYCNSPNILWNKTQMLDFIKAIRAYHTKAIALQWGNESWYDHDENSYNIAMDGICEIHALTDSVETDWGKDIVVGAYLPEVMSSNRIFGNVSNWVYPYFDESIPSIPEVYIAENVGYESGWRKDGFGVGTVIPDMSRRITQFWFFERAAKYIDAGCEMFSLGQVELMDDNDPGHVAYFRLIKAIKRYAAKNARRHFVIIEAETKGLYYCPEFAQEIEKNHPELLPKFNSKPTWKLSYEIDSLQEQFFKENDIPLKNRILLLDYHNQPYRMQEPFANDAISPYSYQPVELVNSVNLVFGNSKGGKNPNGWVVNHNPYHSMLDKGGAGKRFDMSDGKEAGFAWGYEEMAWYAMQPDWYKMYWVCYMRDWFHQTDTSAYPVFQGVRRFHWANDNDFNNSYFGGDYAPSEFEKTNMYRLAYQKDTPNICQMPNDLAIEGTHYIISDSDKTVPYEVPYFTDATYTWRFKSKGYSQTVSTSNHYELNIANNEDKVYELSVFAADSAQNVIAANLARFQIVVSPTPVFHLFPNPVNNLITVEMPFENATLEIIDIQGRILYKKVPTYYWQEIDISNFAKGIYGVRISLNQQVITKTFLKI